MTDRYKEALNRQWQEVEVATSFNQKQTKEHQALALKGIMLRRRIAMNAAFDDHIEFLNEKFKNFKLRNRNGKVAVEKHYKLSPKKAAKKIVGGLLGIGEIAGPMVDFVVDAISSELGDRAVDAIARKDIEKPSKIDVVVRPANLKIVDNKSFMEAERNRINFWMTG